MREGRHRPREGAKGIGIELRDGSSVVSKGAEGAEGGGRAGVLDGLLRCRA